MIKFNNDWDDVLHNLIESNLYSEIRSFLKQEYSTYTIYPPMEDIFNAFKLTAYNDVKVVILGQDPYHQFGQAHGLSFSVKPNVKLPPSLVNVFKELKSDLNVDNGKNGCLEKWAKEGVLLLNTVLTVREGQPNSHKNCGWTQFTDEVIKLLSKRESPIVFLLWGGNARAKKSIIDTNKHVVLECAHPSPLSAYNGFFGCKHFSKTNELLAKANKTLIDWQL